MSRQERVLLRLALAAALLLTAASVGPGPAFGSSADDALSDFAANGRSVAVEVAYDRPGTTIWAPTISFGAGYTEASVTDDPAVLGLGASLYPGGLILVCTEGVTGRCPVGYPLWARSTNVDEEIDAPGGQRWATPDGSVVIEGQTSHAETSSQPRALGSAAAGHVVMGATATIESARSASESLRDKRAIVSKAASTLQGVSLLDGAVKIQSLASESTASLGDAPKASSAVRIEGATFNDKHVTFDDQGLRIVDPSLPPDRADEISKALNEQLLKHFGAKIWLAQAPTVQNADLASAETNGLRIAIQASEGGQGAPWCDPKSGLPPITNCKQIDNTALTLGASSAAVSRKLGEPSGGLIDVGAGVPAGTGEAAVADATAPAPVPETAESTGAAADFGGPSGSGAAYARLPQADATSDPVSGSAESSAPGAAPAVARSGSSGSGVAVTGEAAPIARRIERERVRPAQLALLALSWLLSAACLVVLIVRSRLARARAVALGL